MQKFRNDRRAEANYVTELWCASDIEHPFFKQCADDFGVILKLQQGDDLGDRQLYAIKTALQDCDTVVVIGSDVASLTKDHIVEAFEAIEDGSEIVISPAKDGGYGLIGTSMVPVNIFTGITWGTESVFNELKSNIDKSRLNWDLLPAVWDLDRPEDLANLEKEPMLSDELSTIIRNRVNHNIVK